MSDTIGNSPSIKDIADIVGLSPPYSMSNLRGIRFSSGNSPTTGAISLSNFSNEKLVYLWNQGAQLNSGGTIECRMSKSGDTVIVAKNSNHLVQGYAYIYKRSGNSWSRTTVKASDGFVGDRFGGTVDISDDGTVAIVGSRYGGSGDQERNGTVYVFVYSNGSWSEKKKLRYNHSRSQVYMANAISITGNGNFIVAGSGGFNVRTIYYFYTTNGWSTYSTDYIEYDRNYFGRDVDVDDSGVYSIVRTDIEGQVQFVRRTGQRSFSIYEAITSYTSGITAIAMAPNGLVSVMGENYYNTYSGRVKIWRRSGSSWTSDDTIYPSDGNLSFRHFGGSVSLSKDGNTLVVGAPSERDYLGVTDNTAAGSIYIYEYSGSSWTEKQKIKTSNPYTDDEFGRSCDISDDKKTIIAVSAGASYIFDASYYI